MRLICRRRWVAGLILGAGPAAASSAQDLPSLPPLPAPTPPAAGRPADVPTLSPIVRPLPPTVQVVPGSLQPTWYPGPPDPIALQHHQAGHVEHKARSWGWRRVQGKLWGYPEEFEPRPLGASMYEHGKIMVGNAAAARLVLYQYDFEEGTADLNARGQDQLAKFAAQLSVSPFPLLVERTPADPSLAERRRYAVLARMAGGPCPLPSERVLVGVPSPVGMSGVDAHIIGANSLTRTGQYGPPIPLQSNGVNSPSTVTSSGGP